MHIEVVLLTTLLEFKRFQFALEPIGQLEYFLHLFYVCISLLTVTFLQQKTIFAPLFAHFFECSGLKEVGKVEKLDVLVPQALHSVKVSEEMSVTTSEL